MMVLDNPRAYYAATIATFQDTDTAAILGTMEMKAGNVNSSQRDAWFKQITMLKESLGRNTEGWICFEFVIPRIGKRADNVILVGDQVLVVEFKVGSCRYDRSAINQVVDYAPRS